MSQEHANLFSKRSAAEARSKDVVCFPPAFLSDFVIHFHSSAFPVHKFVLCHHSSYLRAYIEQLTAGERAYAADECSDHPDVTHGIRLPNSCGKHETVEVDCRLFLCPLYFAQQYSCCPYTVDLTSVPSPVATLDCPSFATWQLLFAATSSCQDSHYAHCSVVLVSYFDCARLLSRCEGHSLLVLEAQQHPSHSEGAWTLVLATLEFASKFDLQRVKQASIPLLAPRCCRSLDEPAEVSKQLWERVGKLDKDTLLALLQAVSRLSKPARQ